ARHDRGPARDPEGHFRHPRDRRDREARGRRGGPEHRDGRDGDPQARVLHARLRSPDRGRRGRGALPVAAEGSPGGFPRGRVSRDVVRDPGPRSRAAPGASASPGVAPGDRPTRPLEVRRLGLVPYARGLELQEEAVRRRRAGEIPDTLLLLEHPHVITLGSGAHPEHVLLGPEERARRGIELFETGRGGDVTYHGPGQLVAYPILDLKPDRRDLHAYLRDLEGVVMEVVRGFGVEAWRTPGRTGVWTAGGKLAAIG